MTSTLRAVDKPAACGIIPLRGMATCAVQIRVKGAESLFSHRAVSGIRRQRKSPLTAWPPGESTGISAYMTLQSQTITAYSTTQRRAPTAFAVRAVCITSRI